MTTITIKVPDDVFAALRRSPDEFAREMRQAAAIQWYSQGLISQGKAAEIAGLNRTDFLYSLAHARVDAFQIDAEELAEEVQRDLQARRERLATHLPDADVATLSVAPQGQPHISPGQRPGFESESISEP